jgi:hypothetical protein
MEDGGDFGMAACLGQDDAAGARLLASRHQEVTGGVVSLQELTMFTEKTIHFGQRLAVIQQYDKHKFDQVKPARLRLIGQRSASRFDYEPIRRIVNPRGHAAARREHLNTVLRSLQLSEWVRIKIKLGKRTRHPRPFP